MGNSNGKKEKKTEDGVPLLPDVSGKSDPALLGQKWVQNYGNDVDYLHFHNYLEIGYCYGGDGHMVLGEEEKRFHGGIVTVIPPNYPHTTNSDIGTISKWEYLFIDVEGFMKKFLDNPVKAEKMIQRIYSRALFFEEKENLSISKKIRKIMDIMRDGEEFFLEEAKGVLAALLVEIARLNRDSGEDKVAENAGKLTNMITRVLDYVSYHYMEDIKVEDLANICHISETHFRRVFTSYMKMSPLEYINTVRVYTACELLETTEDPVADIAHKCGFTTNSTFNRNFKQLMGVTPLEWLKRPESYEQQLLRFDIHSEEGW